ncbi:MAG: hypothetical protein GXY33_10940 [Phycisphaerae bacterium]|nr:hypothetical protein [Phycisphaerae bacterium]
MEIAFLLSGLVLLVYFAGVSHVRVLDDAYITYRFAEYLALGHGLVWNVGQERTEGFTSLLHVLLCAGAIRVGWDPLLFTRGISIAGLLMTALLCRVWVSQLQVRPCWLKSGVWVLVLGNGCMVYAGLFGMETLVAAALVTLSGWLWWMLVCRRRSAAARWFPLVGLLVVMARPDALVWLIGIMSVTVGWTALRKNPHRTGGDICFAAAATMTAAAVFWGWRWSYFGWSMPNAFYVKSSQSIISLPGALYVSQYLLWVAPLAVGVAAGLFVVRSSGFRALAAGLIVFIGAYVRFEPLMGTAFRFLLPVFPMLTVCGLWGWSAAYASDTLWTRTHRRRLTVASVAAHDQGALFYYSGWNRPGGPHDQPRFEGPLR